MKVSSICFDFDNTISEEGYDKEPIWAIIKSMKKLTKKGVKIIIYTSRHDKKKTLKWLKRYKVPYNKLLFGKPLADIYVDDRAVKPTEFLRLMEERD